MISLSQLLYRGKCYSKLHKLYTDSNWYRPARLSRHFCAIQLPLDLPDSAIMGTTELFLKACEKLDKNGWNTEKVVFPASRQRVQLMLCMIREEALELKLGPVGPDLEGKAG